MEKLKTILSSGACRGVARSVSGEIRRFERRGVADLFSLVTDEPDFLRGASVADKVIGRGAALLLVKGGARSVYAEVISCGALEVLERAGIEVSFGTQVPNIINRAGTDICPVEKLTAGTESPDEAYLMIKEFLYTPNTHPKPLPQGRGLISF